MISNAGYDAVMVVHILCAVIGFGALGLSGAYGAMARRSANPFESETLRNYFRPGRNLAAWAVMAVPALGVLLLLLQDGDDAAKAYPWIGLTLWLVAMGFASGVIWPAEREITEMFHATPDGQDHTQSTEALNLACARIAWASTVTSVLFLIALVDMVIQPF